MNPRLLRNAAGSVAASAVRLMGGVRRAHRMVAQTDCSLGLFFHDPSRDLFARIISWFRARGYRFLSIDELERSFIRGIPLPKRSVWISFDDAWRRNLTEVVPLIRDWNLPVTIFVPTEEVRRGYFWFSLALRNANRLPEPFRESVLQLWRVPESVRRRVIDHLFATTEPPERETMSIDDIADLAKMPQITIGSHSVNHAIMPNCDDQELAKELTDSKRDLEYWTGRPVRVFSYPNGDFDERTAGILAETGYSLAFTIGNRAMTLNDNPYYVPRLSIMDDGSFSENLCHAFGLWAPLIDPIKSVTAALS